MKKTPAAKKTKRSDPPLALVAAAAFALFATATLGTVALHTARDLGWIDPRGNAAAGRLASMPGPKPATTTVFWVGEEATSDNDYISNAMSAWNEEWQDSFGGYDDPADRCGYRPCAFEPRENPFYAALPYNDLTDEGSRKRSSRMIPWYTRRAPKYDSIMKDRWIEVTRGGTACYAQLADVGPGESDDFDYVFGSSTVPKNTFGLKAGLDVSPAMSSCLGFSGVATTTWRFVHEKDVPPGPWTETVTD